MTKFLHFINTNIQFNSLFLILLAICLPICATSQISAGFTTSSPTNGCGSLIVDFQDLSTGMPDTWLWDFGNGNTSIQSNPTAIYSSPGVYDVKLIVSNNNGVDTITEYAMIEVFDTPNSNLNSNTTVFGCDNLNVSFQDLSVSTTPIDSWLWDFGDGGSSTLQNPFYEYNSPGTYTVSLLVLDTNSCQSLYTVTNMILVNETPSAIFETDVAFSCNSSQNVVFTSNSINATSYNWDFGDGITSNVQNPSHNYSSGLYTVTLIARNGICSDTIIENDMIHIGATIASDFSLDTNRICQGSVINFTDNTNNNPDAWEWDFGDGNTSTLQNPMHLYQSSGNYDVSLTVTRDGQCASTYTINHAAEVLDNPVLSIDVDTTYSCTAPLNVEFTDNTPSANQWSWDFGNGIFSNTASNIITFNNVGNYDVALNVEDIYGCRSDTIFKELIKIENIEVDILASSTSGCIPLDIEFTPNISSIRPIIDWSWNFGDGNFSNTEIPTNEYISSGIFDVSLLVRNDYGCIQSTTYHNLISADEPPNVDFISNQVTACVGESIIFTDLSNTSTNITSWEWDFGDGTSSFNQNPVHPFQFSGIFDIKLIASSNSCSDSLIFYDYIEILEPLAYFEEGHNCTDPYSVEFTNFSLGADEVFWDFGDGNTSISTNPTHTFSSRGVYNVKLSVTNHTTGCTHDFIKPIKITVPIADFNYLTNAQHSSADSIGCVPHEVFLSNNSQDFDYFKVVWSDGYIAHGRVDHILNTTGNFDVTMIVTDMHGCKDTAKFNNMYHVNDVVADFEIANVLGCDSMLVEFSDLSSEPSNVMWSFGDGGVSFLNNPQHIYYNPGFYDVAIYVESQDGCKDTLKRLEYVQFQYPSPNFLVNKQGACTSDSIDFTNLSQGIGITNLWDFGDGNTSLIFEPTHAFTNNGTYDITLTIIDSFSCSATLSLSNHITIQEPQANFTSNIVSSNCPPLISDFSSISSNDVVDWFWDFGDGGTSSIEDPSHLFSSSGNFDVSLIVTNAFGCKDTLSQSSYISIAGPMGNFSISDTLICINDSITFIPNVINTDNYFWDFGDGNISSDSIASHAYMNSGSYNVSLIIENNASCQFTVNSTDNIIVKSAEIEAGPDLEICEGDQIQLNALGNLTSYAWYPSIDLDNPNIQSPIANPISDVMFYVYHFDGICSVMDSVYLMVHNDIPNPSFTSLNKCENDTVLIFGDAGLNTSNISWNWDFGSNTQNTFFQFPVGNNLVELLVINLDNNCSKSVSQYIEIHPLPTANYYADNVCYGDSVKFINNSSLNVSDWEYTLIGQNYNINLPNHNYLYNEPGTYQTLLEVVSYQGCKNTFLDSLTIYNLPPVDFTVKNNCEGINNIFTNTSQDINDSLYTWTWFFGDSNFAIDSLVEYHKYKNAGEYNVSLVVTSNFGCIDSLQRTTKVNRGFTRKSEKAGEFIMAVPGSGEIHMKGLHNEKVNDDYNHSSDPGGAVTMHDLVNGGNSQGSAVSYEATNTSGDNEPNTSTPHAFNEWYSYDHDFVAGAPTVPTITFTQPAASTTSLVLNWDMD